jgi:hypothetical protein
MIVPKKLDIFCTVETIKPIAITSFLIFYCLIIVLLLAYYCDILVLLYSVISFIMGLKTYPKFSNVY